MSANLDDLVHCSDPIEAILDRLAKQCGCGICGYSHDECICVGNRDGNDVVLLPEEWTL